MLTEAGSDLVRPSVLSMHATSEWCVGLRVESDTYHKLSWPSSWEVTPWHPGPYPNSHLHGGIGAVHQRLLGWDAAVLWLWGGMGA